MGSHLLYPHVLFSGYQHYVCWPFYSLWLEHCTSSVSNLLVNMIAKELTIEAHVLGKWLSHHHLVSILNKLSQCPSIPVSISTGKTLVRHVKIWEQLTILKGKSTLLSSSENHEHLKYFKNVYCVVTRTGWVSKPENHTLIYYRCYLRFSFLMPDWLSLAKLWCSECFFLFTIIALGKYEKL